MVTSAGVCQRYPDGTGRSHVPVGAFEMTSAKTIIIENCDTPSGKAETRFTIETVGTDDNIARVHGEAVHRVKNAEIPNVTRTVTVPVITHSAVEYRKAVEAELAKPNISARYKQGE